METQAQQKVVELPDEIGTVTLKREDSPEAVVDLNYGALVEYQDLNIQLPKWRIRVAGIIFRDRVDEPNDAFLIVIGEGTGLPEEFIRISEVPDYANEYFKMMYRHTLQMIVTENADYGLAKVHSLKSYSSDFPVTVS